MIAITVFAKVSVVVLAAAILVTLLRRQLSAASRHMVCTLAIGALLSLPLLSLVLPRWPMLWPPAALEAARSLPIAGDAPNRTAARPPRDGVTPSTVAPDAMPETTRSAPPSVASMLMRIPWAAVLMLIYAGGAGSLLARLAVQQWTVRRLLRRTTALDAAPEWQALLDDCARQLGVRPGVRLLRDPDGTTPLATGVWHHAIVVPAVADLWSDEMRRAVLLHELAHVVRRDCLTQLAAAFACALYWVHPGTWWLARRLRVERELACDDLVLSTGADAHDYAGHLLELAYSVRGDLAPSLVVGMASPRQLEARILALLDAARDRRAPTHRIRAAALAISVVLIVPLAASTARTVSAADEPALQPPTATRAIDATLVARLFTAEYWRDTAAEQLARLADQLKYLSEMRELGYSATDPAVLFKFRQHGVTPAYVRALAAEGFSQWPPDDLLAAVSHGISPEYVRDLKELGYRSLDLAALVRMRSHGIDGEYISALRAFGYDWSLDDLAKARSHGLEPDYLWGLSSVGYQHLSLDRLIRLLSHGVDVSFIRALQALGYGDLTPESLAALRSHGVTATRVKTANEAAGTRLSVDQLTARASRGWRP